MKSIHIFVLALVVGLTLSCSTPQDRVYRAQEKVHTQRLKLVDQYKRCLEKAGADKVKVEACDQHTLRQPRLSSNQRAFHG